MDTATAAEKKELVVLKQPRSQHPASSAMRNEQSKHSSTPTADKAESNKDIATVPGLKNDKSERLLMAVLAICIFISAAFLEWPVMRVGSPTLAV
jgi:hypothetical protein